MYSVETQTLRILSPSFRPLYTPCEMSTVQRSKASKCMDTKRYITTYNHWWLFFVISKVIFSNRKAWCYTNVERLVLRTKAGHNSVSDFRSCNVTTDFKRMKTRYLWEQRQLWLRIEILSAAETGRPNINGDQLLWWHLLWPPCLIMLTE